MDVGSQIGMYSWESLSIVTIGAAANGSDPEYTGLKYDKSFSLGNLFSLLLGP